MKRNDLWREGKFVDLWSLVHFVGGFALGAILVFLEVEPYIASAIGVALFVGWEFVEFLVKIHEHGSNRLSDLVFDYAGFFLAQLYVLYWQGEMYLYIPLVACGITLVLEIWGLSAFLERKKGGSR
jgi:hypothetical protein